MSLEELIARIGAAPGCKVEPPAGLPNIAKEHYLPADLKAFYERCGGLSFFDPRLWTFSIVPPDECVLANPLFLQEYTEVAVRTEGKQDISWSWYCIATNGKGDYLTIDLSQERLGRCYDSFFGYHAMPGDTAIIATSFTDLLTRLYEVQGHGRYWKQAGFVSLGDAYDG